MPPEKKAAIGPTILVKDGVMSSQFENDMKAREHDAQKRRAHQDTQYQMSKQGVGADGSIARLGNNRMITQDAPHLVLYYKKYDQECVSEITMVPKQGSPAEMEVMFTLVCIKCLNRGVSHGQAQLMVRQSHRNFWIDDRVQNRMPIKLSTGAIVQPAGKVTAAETIRCTNVGCGWAVKIIDSVVDEV